METIVTLSEKNRLVDYHQAGCDGVIAGSKYSLRFRYSLEELKEISEYCRKNKLKFFVSVDAFIFEDNLDEVKEYFNELKELDVDGVYFNDLSIIKIAEEAGLSDRLIFDPDNLMTNTLDAGFITGKKMGVVLAREITLDETKDILKTLKKKVDMQVFGHTKLSYSKRQFLSNYYNHVGKDMEVNGVRNYKLVEEKRDYSLPIIEDEFGTRIYSDYVLYMPEELKEIKKYINRAIIEDIFLDKDVVCDAIASVKGKKIEMEKKYSDLSFGKGFLYLKTNKTKDE